MVNPMVNASEQILNLSKSGRFNIVMFAFGLAFDETNMHVKDLKQTINKMKSSLPLKKETEAQMLKMFEEICERARNDKDAFLQALLVSHESQRKDLARYLAKHVIVNNRLDVDTSNMTAVDMMALLFMLKSSGIEILGLTTQGTSMNVASAREIQEFLTSSTTLKSLILDTCTLGDVAYQLLCDGLISAKSLKNLGLINVCMPIDGLSRLACVLNLNHNLEHLYMSFCLTGTERLVSFDTEGLCNLIKYSQTIRCLSLRYQLQTNSGILHLSDAIKQSKVLTNLLLSETSFEESDMEDLSEAVMSSSSLKRLVLDVKTKMQDEGIWHLANALKLASNLRHFELSAKLLQPQGILYLADGIRFNASINTFELRCGVVDCQALMQFNNAIKSTRNLFPMKLDLQRAIESDCPYIIDVRIVSLAGLLGGRQCMVSQCSDIMCNSSRIIG